MSTPAQRVFAAMFDDAAMFPPGNASAVDALAEHVRLRGSRHADLVGPLLVPARSWPDFCAAHTSAGGPPVRVVLIGTATTPPDVPEGVTVSGFEVAVPDTPLPEVAGGASLAAEISIGAGAGRVLAEVAGQVAAGRRVVAKFRTGGTTSEAFPAEELLARVIADATAAGAPLKLTAGLHHAIRHTDPGTGFEHHGFLNVLVAFAEALDSPQPGALVGVLSERDSAAVVAAFTALGENRAAAARRSFVSFGCCGVEDPINDLEALGVLPSGLPSGEEPDIP